MAKYERKKECPESVWLHGPADAYGKCPWCGKKYTSARSYRPTPGDVSDLTQAYEMHYDDDYDGIGY